MDEHYTSRSAQLLRSVTDRSRVVWSPDTGWDLMATLDAPVPITALYEDPACWHGAACMVTDPFHGPRMPRNRGAACGAWRESDGSHAHSLCVGRVTLPAPADVCSCPCHGAGRADADPLD